MKTFRQFLFEARYIGIYPNGGGSDTYEDDKPNGEITNHPTQKTVGNEPHKDNQYFRRPTVKKYVGGIRRAAAKGKKLPPVLGTNHPENPEIKSIVDGNHRLRGMKNARAESVPVENIPHDNIHLMPQSYNETPKESDMNKKIREGGVRLSSLRNRDGSYDMDKPREELGGKTIRHYFVNGDGTHKFGNPQ
jgi:hypothetical protein